MPEVYQEMLAETYTGPAVANRTLKRRKKAGGLAPKAKAQSITALKSAAETIESNGLDVKEQSEIPRSRSKGVSERELSAVLEPYKPDIVLNTSFGNSFSEKSLYRQRRNGTKNLKEAVIEPQYVQEKAAQVTAAYNKPILTIKGYGSPGLTSFHTRSSTPTSTETEGTTPQLPEIQTTAAENSKLAPPTLSEAADLEWKPSDPLGAKSVLYVVEEKSPYLSNCPTLPRTFPIDQLLMVPLGLTQRLKLLQLGQNPNTFHTVTCICAIRRWKRRQSLEPVAFLWALDLCLVWDVTNIKTTGRRIHMASATGTCPTT